MKKIISLMLITVLLFTSTMIIFAEDNEKKLPDTMQSAY